MVTASRDGHTTTRNYSFFKPYRETFDDDTPRLSQERREEAAPESTTAQPTATQPENTAENTQAVIPSPNETQNVVLPPASRASVESGRKGREREDRRLNSLVRFSDNAKPHKMLSEQPILLPGLPAG